MSDRDELARDLFLADNSSFPEGVAEKEWEENGEYHDYAYDIADALIAAGYRKPRTITTVEDLDAAIIETGCHAPAGTPWGPY